MTWKKYGKNSEIANFFLRACFKSTDIKFNTGVNNRKVLFLDEK